MRSPPVTSSRRSASHRSPTTSSDDDRVNRPALAPTRSWIAWSRATSALLRVAARRVTALTRPSASRTRVRASQAPALVRRLVMDPCAPRGVRGRPTTRPSWRATPPRRGVDSGRIGLLGASEGPYRAIARRTASGSGPGGSRSTARRSRAPRSTRGWFRLVPGACPIHRQTS